MRAVTRSHTGRNPISTTLTLTEIAERLVYKAFADHPDEYQISLLAISVSNLVDQPVLQLELPVLPDEAERPGSRIGAARWAVDHSIDAVRRRFGRSRSATPASCCRSTRRCPTSSASSPSTSCDPAYFGVGERAPSNTLER